MKLPERGISFLNCIKYGNMSSLILYKIKELECSLEKDEMKNESKLNIVSSLKNTLLNIDYKFEEIPEYSYNKIIRVLEDINGKALSIEEKEIINGVLFK